MSGGAKRPLRRLLIEEIGSSQTRPTWLTAERIEQMLTAIEPTTRRGYEAAWTAFVDADGTLDESGVLYEVERLCAAPTRTRPEAAVAGFRGAVRLACDARGEASPFDHPAVRRIVKSFIKAGTTRTRDPGPLLDVERVLFMLSDMTKDGIQHRGEAGMYAAAAFACTIPSRPKELCRLHLRDITIVVPEKKLGVADEELDVSDLQQPKTGTMRAQVGQATPGFIVRINVHDSKTDKVGKTGIRKTMQHPHGATCSPALLLADYLANEASTRTRPEHYVFGDPDKGWAVGTLRRRLKLMSAAATGVEVSSKWWRPAAATWLLRQGLDVETVAALGGWATTEALRKYYVRAARLDEATAARIAGCAAETPSTACCQIGQQLYQEATAAIEQHGDTQAEARPHRQQQQQQHQNQQHHQQQQEHRTPWQARPPLAPAGNITPAGRRAATPLSPIIAPARKTRNGAGVAKTLFRVEREEKTSTDSAPQQAERKLQWVYKEVGETHSTVESVATAATSSTTTGTSTAQKKANASLRGRPVPTK